MRGDSKKILVVDDDVTVLRLLRCLLGAEYCLAEASTGEMALVMFASFVPDLVLLDIMMPGIDGCETCRRMRCHPSNRGIQVVMLSAQSSHEEVLRAYAAGADDYVVKPFDPHDLCSRIRLHLRLCGDSNTIGLAGESGQRLGDTVFGKCCEVNEPVSAIHLTTGIDRTTAGGSNRTGLRFRLDSLHSREREALGQIVDGVPNKTIARHLGVSLRTANRIRAAVFDKMGAASAVDLAKMVASSDDSDS